MYEIVPGPGRRQRPFQLKVWADVPAFKQPQGYGPDLWRPVVFVDVHNRGRGTGQVGQRGQQPTPATTYNVRNFVYYTLTQANFNPADTLANGHTKPGYLGDTYVDYNGAIFKQVLKTDFLYSIPDMAKQVYLASKKRGTKQPAR